MWAIIGGSGFEKFDQVTPVKDLDRKTPFGDASPGLKIVSIGQRQALFLPRHGSHHELTPSEINYRANIFALKKYGAKKIMSFSAVGSLQKDLAPGHLVVPSQYIDRTKSLRATSFCGNGIVGHVSLAKPVSQELVSALKETKSNFDFSIHFDKTYVCVEGPYFSTVAESHSYRAMKADIIGMTNFPEYALAREAGLAYLPCCFVTDYDCWDENIPHVTLAEVLEVMRNNNAKAFKIASHILNSNDSRLLNATAINDGLRAGLMTPKEAISPEQRQWLDILLQD